MMWVMPLAALIGFESRYCACMVVTGRMPDTYMHMQLGCVAYKGSDAYRKAL